MNFITSLRLRRAYQRLLSFGLGIGLVCLLVFSSHLPSFAVKVSSVPNPRQNNGAWVVDMADILSPSSEASLNAMITQLETANGAEIAVVTVPDTQPSSSPKAFATDLFNQWGIGKKGIDNGLLFLVSKGDRRTEIETGYAIEAVLPDAKIGDILRDQVTPLFKVGDFDAGIVSGTETIVGLLQAETFAPPTTLELVGRYLGWIFNGVILSIGAGIATLSFNGAKKERFLNPMGKTTSQPIRASGKFLLIGIHWLLGEGDFWGKEKRPQPISLAYDPNQLTLKSWWKSFWIIIIVWCISSIALGPMVTLLLPFAWIWLGYEILGSVTPDSETPALREAGIKLVLSQIFIDGYNR